MYSIHANIASVINNDFHATEYLYQGMIFVHRFIADLGSKDHYEINEPNQSIQQNLVNST